MAADLDIEGQHEDSAGRAEKALWGGRFKDGMDPRMVPLNQSLGFDARLLPYDLQGSVAWARALVPAGVISGAEADQLVEGLAGLATRFRTEGVPADAPDEDVHSFVERLLTEALGPVAGKLHTGRSRNDQVATDFRLWGMDAARSLEALLTELAGALIGLAERSMDVILPGYTHLQQGQPIRGAHWALSHCWPILRDRDRIAGARHSAGVLPLGSGAIAGCPFRIDRDALAADLGFHSISRNSVDAVSDRDWTAELLFACALAGVHLSRLAEDLVLFASLEFGYLALPEGFTTGSSLMPQKRNPDVAELARGKTGRLVGDLTGFLVLLKGLPTGYNRDLQEDKEMAFDAVDTLSLVVPALTGAMEGARFRPERISPRMDAGLLATDIADILVAAGVPFRESHEVVGALVRESEEQGVPLDELPPTTFSAAHAALTPAALASLTFQGSVERRTSAGGTARASVEDQLQAARAHLT